MLRKTFSCLPHLVWRALPHISEHLFISPGGIHASLVSVAVKSCGDFAKFRVFRTPSIAITFSSVISLPADVLWGSFVTGSFVTHSLTPKDVCEEASSVICQCLIVLQFSTCRRCRPKLLLYWLERIMNCLHSFH